MGLTYLNITILLLLLVVFLQDIRYRAIHFVLLLGICILSSITYSILEFPFIDLFKSLSFLVLTFVGLFLYFSFKNKKIINPVNLSIGIGDVLFLVVVIPLFSSRSYILFFISGMLFSMTLHLIIKLFTPQKTIPLAGFLSLYLIIISAINSFTNKNLFYLHF